MVSVWPLRGWKKQTKKAFGDRKVFWTWKQALLFGFCSGCGAKSFHLERYFGCLGINTGDNYRQTLGALAKAFLSDVRQQEVRPFLFWADNLGKTFPRSAKSIPHASLKNAFAYLGFHVSASEAMTMEKSPLAILG